MMRLSTLQQEAVDAWRVGKNVRVVAVPGAGKSAVLLEACKEAVGLCLILAYNHELCQETKQKIIDMDMQDRVACMTFHGLATYCVAPTPDDVALQDVIDMLERGVEPKRRLSHVKHLLIDEAQDMRPSFMKLVPLLVTLTYDTQYMTVGDPKQMLYDYHEDDPASLEYLADPMTHFRSRHEWHSTVLYETHRMTPEMARFVSLVFDTDIKSAKPETETPAPVEVYTVNPWSTGSLLTRLLKQEARSEIAVLVPRKKNNKPLEKAINELSYAGYRLFIHGFDGQDPRVRRHKMTISTWHAAKGTQRQICVVLGMEDEDGPMNPAYVALTRGMRRLIVVMDQQSPSRRVISALQAIEPRDVLCDATTRNLVTAKDDLIDRPRFQFTRELIPLDEWRPPGSGRWLTKLFTIDSLNNEVEIDEDMLDADIDEEDEIVAGLVGDHEDVADVYRLACLMAAEHDATGRVRRWSEIRKPMRLRRDDHKEAITKGCHARFIAPNVPESSLIDAESRASFFVTTAKETLDCNDWCFLACVCRAWNSYHHTLRQMQPFDWMDEQKFQSGLETLQDALEDETDIVFDGRLHCTDEESQKTIHVRCNVIGAQRAYMCVWSPTITRGHQLEASLRATLHPSGECRIVNLRTGKIMRVYVDNRASIISELVKPPERRTHTDIDMTRFQSLSSTTRSDAANCEAGQTETQ
jgi:hypothetical protein